MCIAISLIPIGIIGGMEGFKAISFMLMGLIIIVTLAASFIISYFITRPIVKLTKNIDQISKGKLDVELDGSEIFEINDLSYSIDRIMASLKLAIVKVGVKKDEVFEDRSYSKLAQTKQNDIFSEKNFDYVFTFDENANILDCNEDMYKKLGYSKDEILSLNISDLDVLDSKDDIIKKINKVKDGGSLSFKTIHKKKDGSKILVYENMIYLNDQDKFKCIVREDSDK